MYKLTLVTPQKKLLSDVNVEEVIVPAQRGQLDILTGHAPLMTTLSAGILKVRLADEAIFKTCAISWGYCEVNPQGVIVLADTAEWPEEIDKTRAEDNLKIAEERLQQAGLSIDDQAAAMRKLMKERARLDIFSE